MLRVSRWKQLSWKILSIQVLSFMKESSLSTEWGILHHFRKRSGSKNGEAKTSNVLRGRVKMVQINEDISRNLLLMFLLFDISQNSLGVMIGTERNFFSTRRSLSPVMM